MSARARPWLALASLLLPLLGLPAGEGGSAAAGLATIAEQDLSGHLDVLASPGLEGRDSPSLGLELAARYLAARFEELGLEPLGADGYRHGFAVTAPVPDPEGCRLELTLADGSARRFELGHDFVPVPGCEGQAEGELVFLGFGIDDSRERFDEVPARLRGKIALVIEAEPRHKRRFDGEEVSDHAALWSKLADLESAGVEGVIVMRRAPPPDQGLPPGLREEGGPDIAFRYQFATWVGEPTLPRPRRALPPVLEVDASCAAALLGTDVEELALKADRSGRPPRHKPASGDKRALRLAASTRQGQVQVANVVGLLPGGDPALAAEHVVLGAHYDHVGVDERGRIGHGADDNASGTAALLELAQAFSVAPTRRSLVFCAFAGEEKGLLGSKAFCADPPLALESVVCMLNMDMLGRGERSEVAVLGVEHNPALEDLVDRARKEARTGVRKLVLRQGQELWERSDHFSFHERGLPTLFFLEGLPLERNADYHTWRDTTERLDIGKIANTTRLVFQTAWLLANADERPPRPRD